MAKFLDQTGLQQVWNKAKDKFCDKNDSRLSNSRTPTSHASTATTYGVGTSSNYGHVKTVSGDLNGKSATNGYAASQSHSHSQYALSGHTHDGYQPKGAFEIGTTWYGYGNIYQNGNLKARVTVTIIGTNKARVDFNGGFTEAYTSDSQGINLSLIKSVTGAISGYNFKTPSTANMIGSWTMINSKATDVMGYGTTYEYSGGLYKLARYYQSYSSAVGGWAAGNIANTNGTTSVSGYMILEFE